MQKNKNILRSFKMTNKFQSYVDNIEEKNKFKLLLLPILVVTFIIVLNQFLILILIPIFNDSLKEILSFTGTSNLVDEAFCLFLSIFLITKISKLKAEQLGFSKDNIASSYLKGALFGILQISTVFFIIFALKAIDVYYVGNINVLLLIKVFIIFIFQGLFEEILFRGYLMPMFSKVIGIKFTIILLSFLFTCIHLINPNLDIIGLANVFLAGVTFSLIYYYTGNLWIVGAMHTLWNFILGFIVGSQISGIVTYHSVFFSIPVENKDLISGGVFGFEASIVTTIVELAISLFVIYLIKKEKNKINF
ncbi:CAAX amino terminal protease family protein [Fusobacterium nucleatum subsp. nucleatum ATCC 23726]|nr:CAAX amino terminal protease family protein [Fusobacterium nucleatum subsp. nucleatum ATCC 23726]